MEVWLFLIGVSVVSLILWRASRETPIKPPSDQTSEPVTEAVEAVIETENTPQKLTAAELAQQLVDQFPQAPSGNRLWNDSQTHGLDVQDVDREIDKLREASRRKVVTLKINNDDILDLRELDALRVRIVGSAYWVTETERDQYGGDSYVLVREPHNPHDRKAIAVYGKDRKVGYLSKAKAAALTPLLVELGHPGFRVSGAGTTKQSMRLMVDLPRIPALREFTKQWTPHSTQSEDQH